MPSLSRRRFLLGASQSATAALIAGCLQPARAHTQGPFSYDDERSAAAKPDFASLARQPYPVPEATLETKIGQMLLVGFGGTALYEGSDTLAAISAGRLGGVVLFGHNISNALQLRGLTSSIQQAASIPLLITVDQEGGYVSRLGPWAGVSPNYTAQYLGQINDVELTRQQGAVTAGVLRDMGINLNLAPVVDLNLNPYNPVIGGVQRSYSADPEIVSAHAQATIEAHHERSVGCTLKHFPGHGSSSADTHLGFVDVTDTWSVTEVAPYTKLIAAHEVDAIMTAHIFNATLDPDLPATLSKPVITGLLREKLGYDGVVITDDMRMRAISDLYSPEDAVLKAIDAGVDIIAISNNIAGTRLISATQAFQIIQDHVGTGLISPERIDQSYRRIMRLKQSLGLVTL